MKAVYEALGEQQVRKYQSHNDQGAKKYFLVCFNKSEHFIMSTACNYVGNVEAW